MTHPSAAPIPTSNPAVVIGQRIRRLRRSQGFTQAYVAGRLGMTQTAISVWECGHGATDLETLGRLCTILPSSPEVLTAGIDPSFFRRFPDDANGRDTDPNPRRDGDSIFCQRMRERRMALHLTSRALATACGISSTQVKCIQRGNSSLMLISALRLAAALETTVSYLVGETDDPRRPGVSRGC